MSVHTPHWSLARVYCWFVMPAVGLTFATTMVVAALVGDGTNNAVFQRALSAGGIAFLAMLMVALHVWPRGRAALDDDHGEARLPGQRRVAMVGGRPIGKGVVYASLAVRPVPVERRVVDRVAITRTDLRDTTALLEPVRPGHAVGVAPVAVVEPEADEREAQAAPDALSGYLAGAAGAPASTPDDPEMRGWVAGAVDLERGQSDEDAD